MDSQFVRFLFISTIVGQIRSFPLGCSYNETVYKEEEIVKTNDPCLSCICRRGSLMCNLLVCVDPPDDPSPGCLVVHKANECCPQVFCQDSYKQNIVEVRTPFRSENKTNKNGCHVNGSTYAEGSAMTSSELCEYCYCLGGEMKCIKPHCFFQIEGCRPVYQKSSCCPTYYDCRDVNVNISGILKKSFVKSYPNILNSIKYQRNETTDKKLLKVSRELIRSSKNFGYLGLSEHKAILSASNNFTLASKRKVNDEEEALGKGKKNLENSDSFGSVMGTETEGFSKETTEILIGENGKVESLKSRNPQELTKEKNVEDRHIASDEMFTNSTESGHDYDIYDYSDLKLPPSLPNLVIFPFVAADAVITNHGTDSFEKREKNALKTVDSDSFSSSITIQGEFQLKRFQFPDITPIKNFDFKNGQVSRPPVHFAEDSKMEPQPISPEDKKNSNSSELLNDEQPVVGSSAYFNSDFNKLGKTNRVSIISLMENPKSFDRNQEQTIRPLTVTYKNVVLDYYPEFLITSTRNSAKLVADEITVSENHQKPLTVSDSIISKSDSSFLPEFVQNIQTKPPISDFPSDSLSDLMKMRPTSLKNKTLVDTATLKYSATPHKPFPHSISTTTESFLLNGFVKNSLEERIKPVTTSRHKYSSKTKAQAVSMSEPTKGDLLEKSAIQPNIYNTTMAYVKGEKEKEIIKSPVSTSNTVEPSVGENKDIQLSGLKGESGERDGERIPVDRFEGSSSHLNNKNESVKQLQPNAGNFLKIAGCNIYGRMYRVGKIIPELSEPCLECICTDVGVQCIPLHC